MSLFNSSQPFRLPPAPMGFTGFCQVEINGIPNGDSGSNAGTQDSVPTTGTGIFQPRVSSCDLCLKQSVVLPNVVTRFYGKNVFTMQPEIIEGGIEYPLTISGQPTSQVFAQSQNSAGDLTPQLYGLSTVRDYNGRLSSCNIYVLHSPVGPAFKYAGCIVNTFHYGIKQGEPIKVNASFMCMERNPLSIGDITSQDIPNAIALMWSAGIATIATPAFSVGGNYIRSFDIDISNNCERYYTASDNSTKVQDITAKAFDITGTIVLMGQHTGLADYSLNNPSRYLEPSCVVFGYDASCGSNCSGTGSLFSNCSTSQWTAVVPGVVFLIEELSLTNDVFETIVKWQGAPSDNSLPSKTLFR